MPFPFLLAVIVILMAPLGLFAGDNPALIGGALVGNGLVLTYIAALYLDPDRWGAVAPHWAQAGSRRFVGSPYAEAVRRTGTHHRPAIRVCLALGVGAVVAGLSLLVGSFVT